MLYISYNRNLLIYQNNNMNTKYFLHLALAFSLVSLQSCEEDQTLIEPENTVQEIPDVNARFAVTTQIVDNQSEVTFTNRSVNATSFLWSFPGGTPETSTEENPTIIYPINGSFAITLEAINGEVSDITEQNITIGGIQEEIEEGEQEAILEEEVQVEVLEVEEEVVFEVEADVRASFFVSVSNATGQSVATFMNRTENATSFQWSFPGGIPNTSTEENPIVIYPISGMFTVTLVATNANGSDITEQNISFRATSIEGNVVQQNENDIDVVNNIPAQEETVDIRARFFVNVRSIEGESVVTFRNRSINATSFQWSFPGGSPETSTEENPTVVYTEGGTRTVTLVASNGDLSSSSTVDIRL